MAKKKSESEPLGADHRDRESAEYLTRSVKMLRRERAGLLSTVALTSVQDHMAVGLTYHMWGMIELLMAAVIPLVINTK